MAHIHQRQFISALRAQLGTPYVWGGSAPGGFDCSGIVYWAARQAGIRGVPRTSQQQFRVGTPVPMNGLRPGDLVFMNYEGVGATHVGVYVGGGKILEAPHTGDVVKTLPVSAFAGHILGARRILANPGGTVQNAGRFADQQIAYHQQAAGGGGQASGQNRAAAVAALLASRPRPLAPMPQIPRAATGLQNQIYGQQTRPQVDASQFILPPMPATPTLGRAPAGATPAAFGSLASLDAIHRKLLTA